MAVEQENGREMSDSDKLWDMPCCCGDDGHTVAQGGSHINLVMLKKLAKWPYLAAENFLVPESEKYPLANAVVCDRCLKAKIEIKYAMAGRQGPDGAVYERVPINELEDPEFYWPDHHPSRCPTMFGS